MTQQNRTCPNCQKPLIRKIDWIRDLEEEIETFSCDTCNHREIGNLV